MLIHVGDLIFAFACIINVVLLFLSQTLSDMFLVYLTESLLGTVEILKVIHEVMKTYQRE